MDSVRTYYPKQSLSERLPKDLSGLLAYNPDFLIVVDFSVIGNDKGPLMFL